MNNIDVFVFILWCPCKERDFFSDVWIDSVSASVSEDCPKCLVKHRKNVYGKTAGLSRIQARAWSVGPPNHVKMSHSHLPNSPTGKKPHHFISNLNNSNQNGACTDLYKIALSPTQCPTLGGGGGDVTFLKLSADQLIIFNWLSFNSCVQEFIVPAVVRNLLFQVPSIQ